MELGLNFASLLHTGKGKVKKGKCPVDYERNWISELGNTLSTITSTARKLRKLLQILTSLGTLPGHSVINEFS